MYLLRIHPNLSVSAPLREKPVHAEPRRKGGEGVNLFVRKMKLKSGRFSHFGVPGYASGFALASRFSVFRLSSLIPVPSVSTPAAVR